MFHVNNLRRDCRVVLKCLMLALLVIGWSGVTVGAEKQQGPHGGYGNPHAELGPDQQVRVALQHWAAGREEQALQQLGESIARYPANGRLYVVRASLYLQRQALAEALADLNVALKLEPDNAEALVNRSQALARFGRMNEARADLDRALELNPLIMAAWFNRGVMRFQAGDAEGALADLDRAIAIDAQQAAPHFNRAAVLESLGRVSEAEASMKRFIELADNPQWKEMGEAALKRWQEQQKNG